MSKTKKAEVTVLLEGYARVVAANWQANSSVVLIRSNGKLVIADPGFDRPALLHVLTGAGLTTTDIHYVFTTHGHVDHAGLAGIFEQAIAVDELYTYEGDKIIKHDGIIPGTDIKVIRTPGHKEEHACLLVETEAGMYAVAGDLFWWLENQDQVIDVNRPDNDPEHMNKEALVASRQAILDLADFIIPGHGKVFEV